MPAPLRPKVVFRSNVERRCRLRSFVDSRARHTSVRGPRSPTPPSRGLPQGNLLCRLAPSWCFRRHHDRLRRPHQEHGSAEPPRVCHGGHGIAEQSGQHGAADGHAQQPEGAVHGDPLRPIRTCRVPTRGGPTVSSPLSKQTPPVADLALPEPSRLSSSLRLFLATTRRSSFRSF